MSRQFQSGKCSCWKTVNGRLQMEGTELVVALNFGGKQFLELLTKRIDGKRKPPHRIVCTYCPFCGAKLK